MRGKCEKFVQYFGWKTSREDPNVRMDVREIGLENMNRIHLAQNRDQ